MITGISALSGQQIIASGACSARSAATASYTTGGNDIQGLYTTVNSNSAAWAVGTTYTGDAQGALDEVYSKSGDWNTVTGKQAAGDYYSASNPSGFITGVDLSDYATTAQVADKQDITGMTAYQPIGDYYSASNPSGFITGIDLTPYQTVEGMTAYQPAGSYLTTADSANFYTTANESGFITGVPAGTMNESEFGYDASDNITGYNGSAFKAGDEFPQSATEAIEVVTSNSAEWNDTTDTVSSNSGAWGGSALPISAGPGIKVNLVDNTLVFSNDETVLWSGTAAPSNFPLTMSEPFSAFEKIEFVWDTRYNGDYGTPTKGTIVYTDNHGSTVPTKYTLVEAYANASQTWWDWWYLENDNNGNTLSNLKTIYYPMTGGNSATQSNCRLFKVVGINRK